MRARIAIRPAARRLPLALPLALALAAPAPAGAAFYWVGNGGAPPCTHATLGAAIATAQGNGTEDVILIVGTPTLSGPFTINGGGLQITGGATACGSLATSGRATLTAPGGSRPLTITTGAAGGDVTLAGLRITNQNFAIAGDGGAVSFTAANPASRLIVSASSIEASSAFGDGGGLLVSGGIAELREFAGVLGNSAAGNGGGVAVKNGGVLDIQAAQVLDNVAIFDGGGVHVEQGEVRSVVSSFPFFNAISLNLAGRNGGGLFLAADAKGNLSGSPLGPWFLLAFNEAQAGGGAYVESLALLGSGLRLERIEIVANQAATGGGVYIATSGRVYSDPPAAPTPVRFPAIHNNVAPTGAAIVVHGGQLDLYNADVYQHFVTAVDGSVVAVELDGAARLSGVTMSRNEGLFLFSLDAGGFEGSLALDFTSIAENEVEALVAQSGALSQLTLRRTLIEESEPLYPIPALAAGSTPPPSLLCVVTGFAGTFANLPPGTDTSQLFTGDPDFVDPASGDLHVHLGSAAVDRCTGGGIFGADRDGDARGFDAPWRTNPAGRTFDAGADELVPLFFDDFELGNLSRWSAVVGG